MQDTHTEITTSRDSRSSNDTLRLTRALGSSKIMQAALSGEGEEDNEDASGSSSGSSSSGSSSSGGSASKVAATPSFLMGGTTLRLLQKNSKGKASVRALVVPTDSKIAKQSTNSDDTAKEEAELAARNKMFILESQLAEEEDMTQTMFSFGTRAAGRSIEPKPLLPGQKPKSRGKVETRKINSRAIGLSSAHLAQFDSTSSSARSGGGVKFAKRGFGNR